MKTNPTTTLRAFWLGLLLFSWFLPLRAEQFGLFTYRIVEGSTVEIENYPDDAVAPVVIPAVIA